MHVRMSQPVAHAVAQMISAPAMRIVYLRSRVRANNRVKVVVRVTCSLRNGVGVRVKGRVSISANAVIIVQILSAPAMHIMYA